MSVAGGHSGLVEENWECLIVGGGAAGLSAALVLGRARRKTLVVDAGEQSNRPAEGIGGLLGHDRRAPADLYAAGRRELARYPTVHLRAGQVVAAERDGDAFRLELADGSSLLTKRLLLAGGMDYRYPDLPGIGERWGRSVFHCPFCHGWEHREQRLGVLDRGPAVVERALLLRMWSGDVTILADGPSGLDPEQSQSLAEAGIAVEERRVLALRGPGSALEEIVFADGSTRPLDALLVPVTLHQRSLLAKQLGVAFSSAGPMGDETIEVDPRAATNVQGVFAAGDVTTQMTSVAHAIAAGSFAAAAVVHDLVQETAHALLPPSLASEPS
jgi:thioredoxin reductase